MHLLRCDPPWHRAVGGKAGGNNRGTDEGVARRLADRRRCGRLPHSNPAGDHLLPSRDRSHPAGARFHRAAAGLPYQEGQEREVHQGRERIHQGDDAPGHREPDNWISTASFVRAWLGRPAAHFSGTAQHSADRHNRKWQTLRAGSVLASCRWQIGRAEASKPATCTPARPRYWKPNRARIRLASTSMIP